MDTKRYTEGGVVAAGCVDKHPALYGRAISLAADAEEEFRRLCAQDAGRRGRFLDRRIEEAAARALERADMVAQLFERDPGEVVEAVDLLVDARKSLG